MRFAEFFQQEVGAFPPFAIPPEYVALEWSDWQGASAEVLIASEAARAGIPLITNVDALAELPIGYFLAGFAGYGVNSYSFFFCEVDAHRRVFFRLPYGGAYEDRALERCSLLNFLRGYALTRARPELRSLRAFESPPNAHYEVELVGGARHVHTKCIYPFREFSVLLGPESSAKAPVSGATDVANLRRLITKLRELAAEGARGAWSEADGALAWLNLRRATEAILRALDTPANGETTTEKRALATLRQLAADNVVSTALAERFASWVAARGEGFPAVLTPRTAIADILVPRTDDIEALTEILAARGRVPPPASSAKRVKGFVLGERRVELESLADDQWRVVIDGVPIPMTFRETESTRTNSAYYDKELRSARAVSSINFGPCVRQSESFEAERTKDGWRAVCRWRASATAMYNTVISDRESIDLHFPLDCSSVAVLWDHHTDLSS